MSALRLASTWPPWRSPGGSGCLRRGAPGQRGNRAAKNSRGSQLWDRANECLPAVSLANKIKPISFVFDFWPTENNEEVITPPSTYLAQWCLVVLIKSVLVLPTALIIPMRSCQTINFFSFNYDKPPFCCGFEPSSHGYLIKIVPPLGIPCFTVRNKNTLFVLLARPLSPPPHLVAGP